MRGSELVEVLGRPRQCGAGERGGLDHGHRDLRTGRLAACDPGLACCAIPRRDDHAPPYATPVRPRTARCHRPRPVARPACRGATVTIINVVDGDTLDVQSGDGAVERTRPIGIDTPETVDP